MTGRDRPLRAVIVGDEARAHARRLLDAGAPIEVCALSEDLSGAVVAGRRATADFALIGFGDLAMPSAAPREPILSPRETLILSLIANSQSASNIAERLGVSTNTARSYVQSILEKLHAHSRLEAVLRAHELGLMGFGPRRTAVSGSADLELVRGDAEVDLDLAVDHPDRVGVHREHRR